ncbi:activated protein kinase catalytic subunit alpha-1 [Seminavis robusta]|uniref:guanylate cyclase n=1 Tax=Seminavis robusta TaxID=568900 RepID=A0A9N8E6I7_9STRA|nr:activated protein kinase catalytic subunit alpha-1 [Seminavis robusta]|eukprot:Sro703_g190100.1 activated protein kinase catalytic subunit alpha-1 (1349) ;mRNA; r:18019-23181
MKASILPVFVAATLISAVAGQDYFFIEGQDTPLIGYSSDIYVQRDDNNCTTIINNYNHLVHKPKYVVGVFSSEGDDIAFRNYNLTFGQYLTATAGQKIDPPVEFDMVAGSMTQLAEMAEAEQVDFIFGSSAVSSCMATEYDAQPLVTVISRREARGHEYDLDLYGGVIFTLADNNEVNSIHDLKDRTIGAGGITAMGGGQAQFYEMVRQGLSYVNDPKQVVFTIDEALVVQGVIDGEFEIGLCRTDQIERHIDANTGKPVDPSMFKVINAQTHSLHDGRLFPFKSSTSLHPEWPVTALNHVAVSVAESVQEALLALQDHAMSIDFQQNLRCETTPALADLAQDCKTAGMLTGFRPARNYFSVRTKQEKAGFLNEWDDGKWHCIRGQTLYHDIACPDEYYKILEKHFAQSCTRIGLECPHDFECYCKPCIHRSVAVDVFEYGSNATQSTMCEKMKTCGSVEQTQVITFRIVDHMERTGAKVAAIQSLGEQSKDLEVVEVGPWTYEFQLTEPRMGMAIVAIAIDDIEIYDSPIRVEVAEKTCDGEGKVATEWGDCVCKSDTVDINGTCVDVAIFAAVGSVAGFILIVSLIFAYIEYKNHKADEMWKVDINELLFDDPVEVIGQGSFGVVLLAEYRGTKVAIKQAVKGKGSGSTKGGSGKRSVSYEDSAIAEPEEIATRPSMLTDDGLSDCRTEESSGDNKFDVESGKAFNSNTGSNFALSRRYDGATLTFLGGYHNGGNSKWAWLCPWMKKNDYQARFKETILGNASASASRKTFHEMFCPWFNENVQRQEEFVKEMRVLSLLRHPCITTVMGAVISRNHVPMLVMEYMDYGSLHDLLRNETMYLTGEIISQITRSVGQGLRYLHSSKPPILHGDLKARNILIDSRFRAKLCDFGLSTKQDGRITGTPFWLAPEYLRGETEYDSKCDIYSCGIILYEIYSRKNPYEGEDFKMTLQRVCDKRINKRPDIPGTTPPKLIDLMKKCWNRDRNFRPSARDLDLTLMDFNSDDFEPLTDEQQTEAARKRRTGDMLYELFPKHIADALQAGKKVEPETHNNVTVIFSDIVHFTDISQRMDPLKVSCMLDNLYLSFDKIARRHNIFKVETIGDAYMGVTNLENKQEHNHVKCAAEFAIDMVKEASQILIDPDAPEMGYINIRVGFHSGPVVSNVIGSLNPRYGLFGDTVNTASRMESNSSANRILCSEVSYNLLKEQSPGVKVKKRGKIKVKGKGEMIAYWVGGSSLHKQLQKREQSIIGRPKVVEFEEEPTEVAGDKDYVGEIVASNIGEIVEDNDGEHGEDNDEEHGEDNDEEHGENNVGEHGDETEFFDAGGLVKDTGGDVSSSCGDLSLDSEA